MTKELLELIRKGKLQEAITLIAQHRPVELRFNEDGEVYTTQDINSIFNIISPFNCITSLIMSGNIDDRNVVAIIKGMKSTSFINNLSLNFSNLGDKGAIAIANYLESNKTLTGLDLGWNNIGPKGAQAIANALSINSTLTGFDISSNKETNEFTNPIKKEGLIAIFNALASKSSQIKKLSVNSVYFEKDENPMIVLAKALKINTTLTHIDLNVCGIQDNDIVTLANVLKLSSCPITHLWIASNLIGDVGARALAKALITNSALTYIDMNDNSNITDRGALALLDALKVNKSINYFEMYECGKTISVMERALETLKINKCITYLNVSAANETDDLKVKEVREKIKLQLWGNQYIHNNGHTPLHIAAKRADSKIREIIMQEDADVHIKNNNRYTPLHIAAKKGSSKILEIFMQEDPDVFHINNINGYTPLMFSIDQGDFQAARALVVAGANVNQINPSGLTCLHYAVKKANIAMVKLLIDNNADINQIDNNKRTPLSKAIMQLFKEGNYYQDNVEARKASSDNNDMHIQLLISDMLIQKENVRIKYITPNKKVIYLHFAAAIGNEILLKELLKSGADINYRSDKVKKTTLHVAAKYGYNKIVKTLIEYGSEVDSIAYIEFTPLLIASKYGHTEVVKTLIEKGADIKYANSKGQTALNYAIVGGYIPIIDILLEAGADINAVDKKGFSPLHYAVKRSLFEIVGFLIDKEILINCQNHKGKTPLYFAKKYGNEDIVDLIKKHLPLNQEIELDTLKTGTETIEEVNYSEVKISGQSSDI